MTRMKEVCSIYKSWLILSSSCVFLLQDRRSWRAERVVTYVWGQGGGDELAFEDCDSMVRVDSASVAVGR
jgi:hypothetical protein